MMTMGRAGTHTLALAALAFSAVLAASNASPSAAYPGLPAAFTVPAAFPTSVYSTYYVKPGPTSEPQPAIFDPVLNITFPFNLTNPETIPTIGTDPVLYP